MRWFCSSQIPQILRRRVVRLSIVCMALLLALSLSNVELELTPTRALAQATADTSGMAPCSAGVALSQAVTPVPTATKDPNAPTATPRPATATPLPAPTEDRVGFPKDYQTTYKLLFVLDRPGTSFRVICGNDAAASWKPGEPFSEGSIMTMDVYAVAQANGKPILDLNGHFTHTILNGIFVMRKEPGFGVDYKDLRNGDWEYAAYKADGSFLDKPEQTAACAACHLKQAGADIDYVFRTNLFGNKNAAAVMPKVGDNTVQMWAYAYNSPTLTVSAGTTVTWVNNDDAEHTVDTQDGSISSGTLKTMHFKTGNTFSYKFEKAGTYDYFCKIHAFMKGTIVVQ